jgi:hypothetical protein
VRTWTREAGALYAELRSTHGHDGFLLEPDAAGALLSGALEGGAAGEQAVVPFTARSAASGTAPRATRVIRTSSCTGPGPRRS